MNRKRRSSTRPQQSLFQYLESIDSLELRERSQHHLSTPFLESDPDTPANGGNTTTTVICKPANRPRRVRIATWVVVGASILVLAASLAFLSWLWFVDRENESWRYLVLTGRATQSITLMGVLIRWAIGSLAAITTSMATSIAVERDGILKAALAEVSIARFTNSGPYSFKRLLPGTTLRGWIRVCMIILFFLVAASQLSSTLLVADLQLFQLNSFPQHMGYGYTTWTHPSGQLVRVGPLFWKDDEWSRAPVQAPIFAEYLEPGQLEDNIDDTGLTLRAFLPIDSQSKRERIHSFTGMARIIDSRVICVQPRFSVQFYEGSRRSDANEHWGHIEANITANLSNVPQLYHSRNKSITDGEGGRKQYSGSLLARVPINQCNIFGKLCINSWIRTRDIGNGTWTQVNSSTFGPWAKQFGRVRDEAVHMEEDYEIQMSLCFDSFIRYPIKYLNITASTNFNHTEPAYVYDPKTGAYDTLAMRNQLGAVNREEKKESVEHEILKLSGKDLNRSLKVELRNLSPSVTGGAPDLCICPGFRGNSSSSSTSGFALQVFNDVLDSTGSPALALQTLYTLIYRQTYYNRIPWMTPEDDPATITTFEVARAPQQVWGLIAVMAIVAGNVLVFLIVAFFFLYATDSSFIDNAWHTIAQISQSEDVKVLLERARLTSDKDVEEWLRDHEPSKGKIGYIKDFFRDTKLIKGRSELSLFGAKVRFGQIRRIMLVGQPFTKHFWSLSQKSEDFRTGVRISNYNTHYLL
ncbi:hypothetical protein DER45DRAFT_640902 [Fusarium avenaceum]|nr:hypothetical protein DER45DRAFT_640902 [Fusarium avenaceum]